MPKPELNLKDWATGQGALSAEPTEAQKRQGWTTEQPAVHPFNWLISDLSNWFDYFNKKAGHGGIGVLTFNSSRPRIKLPFNLPENDKLSAIRVLKQENGSAGGGTQTDTFNVTFSQQDTTFRLVTFDVPPSIVGPYKIFVSNGFVPAYPETLKITYYPSPRPYLIQGDVGSPPPTTRRIKIKYSATPTQALTAVEVNGTEYQLSAINSNREQSTEQTSNVGLSETDLTTPFRFKKADGSYVEVSSGGLPSFNLKEITSGISIQSISGSDYLTVQSGLSDGDKIFISSSAN